jgi:hypothetical protein
MENNLVVCNKFEVALSGHVRELPGQISAIKLENQVVAENELWVAGVKEIKIETSGVFGTAYIQRHKLCEMEKQPTDLVSLLRVSLSSKNGHTEHDGKKYSLLWVDYAKEWIVWHNQSDNKTRVNEKFIGEVKKELLNCKKTLVSNEFLAFLFQPIFDALIKNYNELANF